MRGQAAVERFFSFLADDSAASESYGMWSKESPRPTLAAFATASQLTDAPRFHTGYNVDLNSSKVSALYFRALTEGSMDTLVIWTNCGKPQCDTRSWTRVELSVLGVVVRNGFGRLQRPTAFNASALPTYISVSSQGLEALVVQLRAQLSRSVLQ